MSMREQRDNTLYGFVSKSGRSTARLDCPFCGASVVVYLWSISGCGKRCTGCKAIHYWGSSVMRTKPALRAGGGDG